MQVFKVIEDGTTVEMESEGAVKDILENDECYILVSDDVRKVFLWKGLKSNVRSKFIGARTSQEIRGQVGMHYSVEPLDQGQEPQEFIDLIGGPTTDGVAQEITGEESEARAQAAKKALSKGSSPVQNVGPLYTGKESFEEFEKDQTQVDFEEIMKKLEEIDLPPGYERELVVIGNHAYSVVEKVQTFLGKKQVERVIEKVQSIPEGAFFAKEYSPRVHSENGQIIAIEFLKHSGGAAGAKPSKDLSNQIKSGLEKKK
ncbi:MAG: hypothetical protein EU547_03965 [Promethearchaeota archaeon]|nr:MAG: hypothetical protein EU547_03965 [Candidatus Lokiarchaeota archaeon]